MIDIPTGLTNAAMWAIVVGFVQPVALQLILQSHWSKRWQSVGAFIFSIITGGLTALFAGAFNGVGIVTTILIVLVASISTYKGFWNHVIPALKPATSAKPVKK